MDINFKKNSDISVFHVILDVHSPTKWLLE